MSTPENVLVFAEEIKVDSLKNAQNQHPKEIQYDCCLVGFRNLVKLFILACLYRNDEGEWYHQDKYD